MARFVHLNPTARSWTYKPPPTAAGSPTTTVLSFHKSLPEYNETTLHSLPGLAKELGLSHVLLKDESNRFGLPAFKILGASWCVYRAVGDAIGLGSQVADGRLSVDDLGTAARERGISLVTSTEGNCGRAVSRMARYLGIPVRVFVPSYMDEATRQKVRGEGAEVLIVQGGYDDTIPVIRKEAEKDGVLLILDVGVEGFERIPSYFIEGYGTMLAESEIQVLEATGGRASTHAIVPCGAGSIAQAVTQHFQGSVRKAAHGTASVVAVEPTTAACLKASLEAGVSTSCTTGDSIMCGMNSGILSTLAWPVLKEGIHASVVVTELEAHQAVTELKEMRVTAGPCGAATVAALRRICADSSKDLGLGSDSVVILFCTEGAREYLAPAI
jgi:diaminopropionate ammonia-lyase